MRETETKLNNNMRENNTSRVKVLELEQELKGKIELQSAQITDLQAKETQSKGQVEALELAIKQQE